MITTPSTADRSTYSPNEAALAIQDLARRVQFSELQSARQRGTFQFWHLILASSLVFILMIMAAMYAHQRGFITFEDPASPKPSLALPLPPAQTASQPVVSQDRKGGDFRDLLTILVPTFAVAVAFMVGAAGMRRLETYDEEFARARRERREDAADLRSQLDKVQEQFAEQLQTTLGAQVKELVQKRVEAIESQLREQTEIAQDKLEQATSASRESAERSAALASSISDRLERDFSLVKAASSAADLLSLPVIAVGRIEKEIEAMFNEGKDGLAVNLVATCLANSERIQGEPNDWFNVSAELGRRDNDGLALAVCKTALARCFGESSGPASGSSAMARQDLIAHAISYATKTGDWSEAELLVAQAEEIGRERWAWRLFTFVGDYFESLGDDARYNELNTDFARYHPFDERAYSQPASRLYRLGRLTEAEEIIKKGLQKEHIRAQQLCAIYTNLLLDQGRYDEVIETATIGLANLADAQPSTATYAIVFRRAAAFDAKATRSLLNQDFESAQLLHWVREAMKGYRATLDFGGAIPPFFRRQVDARIRLLTNLFSAPVIDNLAAEGRVTGQGL